MRWILTALTANLLIFPVFGESMEVERSHSPDGKFYLTIEPTSVDEEAAGTVRIRETKTNKVVGSFNWDGFGYRADAKSFETLWRPDDKAFSIYFEETRGSMRYAVYHLQGTTWESFSLPEIYQAIFDKYGMSKEYSKFFAERPDGRGCEKPIAWFSNGDLSVQKCARSIASFTGPPKSDTEQMFAVRINLSSFSAHAKSQATISSIQPIPWPY